MPSTTKPRDVPGNELADILNRDCHCIAVDKKALQDSLGDHLKNSGLPTQLFDKHSHLFADSPVFLSKTHINTMAELIRAIDKVSRNASYRDAVLADAPVSARRNHGPNGVFFGYDFHLGEEGPQLIEVNTNAGGVLLNTYLSAAQQACCSAVITFFGGKARIEDVEVELVHMFRREWLSQRADEPLRTIAIIDDKPKSQFLYPELLLFQSLFERHEIQAIIADPEEFAVRENSLWVGEQQIDLVYNRLTDFYLQSHASACLLEAYEKDLAVFTPAPYHYALYADKRNLPILSDGDRLRAFGVDDKTIDTLGRSLPNTVVVTQENADELWGNRKNLFFKPATGFGSRGAYRGAKITRKVWQNIIESDYVAQAVVSPSERQLLINGEKQSLKLDIRCVTYGGRIQQLSARLYRGQTTNLRTEGGGLATVFATG